MKRTLLKHFLILLPINCIIELFENDAHNIVSRKGWEKLNEYGNTESRNI
jgi:hypothetical protein